MQGLFFEDLKIGDQAQIARTVADHDIAAFAAVSGDINPIHLDEAYAKTTSFGERIAHGMLTGAYLSAVLGTKMPGPGSIYLSQTLRFRRPVKIGDEVVAKVTVKALDERRAHATFETVCEVAGKVVADGEALIMVPRRPG